MQETVPPGIQHSKYCAKLFYGLIYSFPYVIWGEGEGGKSTFINISAISWWSVLLVDENGVPGENNRIAASH